MEEKKTKPKAKSEEKLKTKLERWENEGIPLYYVRFTQPIPPYVDQEPVAEFRVSGPTKKYIVDKITYTEHGLIWRAKGEVDIVGLTNVMYTRAIQ